MIKTFLTYRYQWKIQIDKNTKQNTVSPSTNLSAKDDLKKLNKELKEACYRSDKIIAVSESTKNDIVDQFSVSPDKVTVIYQSCDPVYFEKITEEKKYEFQDMCGLSVS